MRSLTILRLLALVLLLPCAGMAQAFLPGKSEGSASINFTTIHAAGHFLDDGSRLPGYASRANSLTFGLDYGLTHSCYDPDPAGNPCQRCDSCRLRARGFAQAGVADPALRQVGPRS